MPVVASTDSANPNERANQGSTTSMPIAAKAMSGTPRTGRPDRCTTSTTTAITVARTIDGSGRTSTTKASRTATADAARMPRGAPQSRPTTTTRPTTTAQFDPDTAVRWVSADVSMAASVSGARPERSPIARPRRSAAPGSGRPAVARTKAWRAASVAPSSPPGGSVVGAPRTKSTNAVAAPGTSGSRVPVPVTRVPAASTPSWASPAGTSRTGTRSAPRPSARSSVVSTDRSPGPRSRDRTASNGTAPEPEARARSGSGARRVSPTVTETASSAVSPAARSTGPAQADAVR